MSAVFDFEPLLPSTIIGGPPLLHPGDPGDPDVIYADAHASGYAAGLEAGAAACGGAIAALQAAVADLSALRAETAAQVERQAVELALKIAEQAVHVAIAADPELVLGAVRGALRKLVERERVIVLLHPDDLELVRDMAGSLLAELGGIEHLEVQADRRVPAGGAIVRTAEGEVDATIETKLQRAREVLERELTNA
jgi:flagellar assembly protein FliH